MRYQCHDNVQSDRYATKIGVVTIELINHISEAMCKQLNMQAAFKQIQVYFHISVS
jgi:hypothetical protein